MGSDTEPAGAETTEAGSTSGSTISTRPATTIGGRTTNTSNNNNTRTSSKNNQNDNNRGNRTSSFLGNVANMQGNVFQLHSERREKGQFQDTLDALKTLAATEFKSEIRYLEPLFRELTNPVIPLPIKPEKESIVDPEDSTKTVTGIDPVKEDIYKAQIQAYVKKEGKLDQTKAALVNILMAQCSKPMKNKLKGVKGFEEMEIDGDIAGVLKAIRDVSNQIEDSTSSYETIDELHRQFFFVPTDARRRQFHSPHEI